jgi:hypothetical protein
MNWRWLLFPFTIIAALIRGVLYWDEDYDDWGLDY